MMDKQSALNPMSVLTDCNDNWIIFFFFAEKGKLYLATSEIEKRGIALAIIKQKRTKFHETITEKVDFDNRMADLIDDMTEKELYNMSMRKRLKSVVKRDEQPIIDQFISKFSDDYEIPSLQMFA
ncbi:8866_t:CDS:2 [Diversispora eburnea]|uniref:8866_t:CDS:1 n=1 Tax=Diversispora eburnea TaxID=1213867 RepID=A0A9N9AUB8_9GLOM|nr:8866_t:CDS:2 [Diversispora eburnea]